MQPADLTSRSRFSRYALLRARYVLAAFGMIALFLLGISLSPLANDATDTQRRGSGDVALYKAEIDRISAGESYYAAAGDELRSRGYPTRSVFNWRTPLPMWLIGVLPTTDFGKAILGLFALALLLAAYELSYRESGVRVAIATVLLLSGALLPCVLNNLFVMPELWSGVLIALSLCAYGLGRPGYAVAAGLVALVMRELAAPYCLLALIFAYRDRQRREVLAWLAAFAAYAGYFAWHAAQVAAMTGPNEIAHENGWLWLGGAPFVLAVTQMNAYLLLLPQWVTALYLVAAMIGFASWNSPIGERAGITAAAYLATFAFVGQPFNQYWGCMLAPTLCLGAARAPAALADLVSAAGWRLPRLSRPASSNQPS